MIIKNFQDFRHYKTHSKQLSVTTIVSSNSNMSNNSALRDVLPDFSHQQTSSIIFLKPITKIKKGQNFADQTFNQKYDSRHPLEL